MPHKFSDWLTTAIITPWWSPDMLNGLGNLSYANSMCMKDRLLTCTWWHSCPEASRFVHLVSERPPSKHKKNMTAYIALSPNRHAILVSKNKSWKNGNTKKRYCFALQTNATLRKFLTAEIYASVSILIRFLRFRWPHSHEWNPEPNVKQKQCYILAPWKSIHYSSALPCLSCRVLFCFCEILLITGHTNHKFSCTILSFQLWHRFGKRNRPRADHNHQWCWIPPHQTTNHLIHEQEVTCGSNSFHESRNRLLTIKTIQRHEVRSVHGSPP